VAVPFRRWLHGASATERASTGATVAVVVALLAWALVPAPSERSAEVSGIGALPSPGETLDRLSGGALPDAALGGTSAGGPGGAGAASPSGQGSVGSTGGGSSVSGGTAGRLTASDRGVTPEVIKLGLTTLNFDTAAAIAAADLRKDSSRAVDAFVDYVNKQGGVLGRRIQPVKVSVDLVDAEQQRQKCLELPETDGVFAVIDSFAFSFEPSTACVTAEHNTLLVNGNPGASENVRRGFPYHVSVHKDDNRKMKDLVAAAKGAGFFDPAKGFKKLGLLLDNCSDSVTDAPDGLRAYLKAAGLTSWSEFRADCGDNAAQGPPQQAVLRFNQGDVTHVLMAARPPIVKQYLDAAKGARYFPKYFLGDYFNLVQGIFNDDYDPEGLNGALAVTETHAGEGSIGRPLPPLTQTCSKILTDHGLAPVSSAPPHEFGDDMEVLGLCEHLLLFVQVATAAGTNLTRATWVNALAGVGDFSAATVDLARFDRVGKMTGGDTMKLVRFHSSCTCWKEQTGFQPAAG
jgi:ABC-type branched-subunit amino acid transport system substrate-binding protein